LIPKKGEKIVNKRYHELDSIRGLAAMSVVFAHYLNIFPSSTKTNLIEYGPTRLLVAGNEAVLLFFLLSGFVLALPFLKGREINLLNYRDFAIKRVARIYLPYLAVILIAVMGNYLLYTGDIKYLSTWFNNRWAEPISLKAFIDHVVFLGDYPKQFNTVTWSLVEELRISLIFPILMIFVLRFTWIKNVIFAFSLFLISILVYLIFGENSNDISGTISYSAIFVIGAILAKHKDDLFSYLNQLSKINKLLFIAGGLFLYVYAKPSFALNSLFGVNEFYRIKIDFWFTVSGAAMIVIMAISFEKLSNLLSHNIINFFGKISFSVYLYHLIVLLSFVYIFDSILPIWVILVLSFAVTIGISTLSYYYIELPSMNFGKRLVSISYKEAKIRKSDKAV
jgi:peptidoglycan/LPS O-acetylase OafA/YrhL